MPQISNFHRYCKRQMTTECLKNSTQPLVHLHLIFEISSLQTWFLNLIFCLFWTGFLKATQAVKIKFEIDKKSSSKIKFKNQVQKIKLKNQYQVQMDKGSDFRLNYDQKRSCNFYRLNLTLHNCYFPTYNSLPKIYWNSQPARRKFQI